MIVNYHFQSLLFVVLLRMVAAQESPFDLDPVRVSSSSTSPKDAQTHSVAVGKGNHQFVPDTIQALVGDIIEFQFFPPNHSVVRAEFGIPCIPYELTGGNKVGFFSGFYPVSQILDDPPTYNLVVNDTEPVFFYCAAPGSCINFGMVGVINPNNSDSLAEQQANAKKATYMLAPGEPLPSNEDGSSPSIPTASSAPSAPAAHGKKLSSGAIAGIAVAGVVAAGLVGAFLFLLGRNSKTLARMRKDRTSNVPSSHMGYESGSTGMQSPYSSKPMSDYNPYAPLSPYGLPVPQSPPPVELSSPEPDHSKHYSVLSEAAVSDDARWQTITPPPQHQATIHSELDASQGAQSPVLRDTRRPREDPY